MKASRHLDFSNVPGSPYATGVLVFPRDTDLRVDTGTKYRDRGFTTIAPSTCGMGWKLDTGGLWRLFKIRIEGHAVLRTTPCALSGQFIWGDGSLGDRPITDTPPWLWLEIEEWAKLNFPADKPWELAGTTA